MLQFSMGKPQGIQESKTSLFLEDPLNGMLGLSMVDPLGSTRLNNSRDLQGNMNHLDSVEFNNVGGGHLIRVCLHMLDPPLASKYFPIRGSSTHVNMKHLFMEYCLINIPPNIFLQTWKDPLANLVPHIVNESLTCNSLLIVGDFQINMASCHIVLMGLLVNMQHVMEDLLINVIDHHIVLMLHLVNM